MLDSRLGKIFIIIYALFAIIMPVMALMCGFEACGPYLIYPIMPWAYIFTQELSFDFPWAIYPAFLILNVCVVYTVGVIIEWLYHRYHDRRS